METMFSQIRDGKLVEQNSPEGRISSLPGEPGEFWIDIQSKDVEEIRKFLTPLDLHPVQLTRCLDSINTPGVISFGKSLLMEYPAAFNPKLSEAAYLSILLQSNLLITIRHGSMPALDELIRELKDNAPIQLVHLPQIIYLILDEFSDLNAEAQVEIRDHIQALSNKLTGNAAKVKISDLAGLRTRVENMVSLAENQLYCISALNASDNAALKDPHRKAFIQDILSETEITQRGVYRLESRMRDLYSDFQAAGNDRVEKRLRLLTIVSALTLPLGLMAGLLGMNVGGVPGIHAPFGFAVVIILMTIIIIVQYWFFKRKGWFD